MSFGKSGIIKIAARSVVKIYLKLPNWSFIDRAVGLFYFLYQHHRLPGDHDRLNFLLYKLKTSGELLKPERVYTTDKEFVKLFIKSVVGDQYNIPTFGVIRSPDELESYEFPNRCVIKPTHLSGDVIIRTNGETIDRNLIRSWFQKDYYKEGREINYKFLTPKIIVEEIAFDDEDVGDVKLFCQSGRIKFIQCHFDRRGNHTSNFYDSNWEPLNFSMKYPVSSCHKPRPGNFDEITSIAEKLSAHFTLVRVDLYISDKLDKIYVGEITHCHGNAGEVFIPIQAREIVNKLLQE